VAEEVSEYGLAMPTNRAEPYVVEGTVAERRQAAKEWIAAWRARSKAPAVSGPGATGNINLGPNAVLGLMWVVLLAYVFLLAPNFTPMRDEFFVKALVGVSGDAARDVNQIFRAVFNLMGVWPAVYMALLIPSAKSRNGVPAWPFCAASFFLGMFALLPFMALWEPQPAAGKPPKKEDLSIFVRGLENPVLIVGLLGVALYQFYLMGTATGPDWLSYVRLFDESRLVHVTTIDFTLCTLLSGYWVSVDAKARGFQYESASGLLGFLPLVGPLLYLLVRPKATSTEGA